MGIWLLTILNLAINGILLILTLTRYFDLLNIDLRGTNNFILPISASIIYSGTLNRLVSYIGFGIYFIVSFILIRKLYKLKIRNMYLSCTIQDIDEMTGIQFEYFLLYKFRQRKYKVKTTPITGDYGADLVLKKRKEKIVVQAKRYQNDVGIAAVQEVIGSIAFYGAEKGMVITNSYFTPNAINLADANDIILWDRNILIEEFLENEETDSELSDMAGHPGKCPYCGKLLVHRTGKYGDFIGCSGYPKCNYSASINATN